MNIIWGYKADPHITAQQLRNTYIGIFGEDAHILDVGSELAATVVSATEIQIADGVMVGQGCTASIETRHDGILDDCKRLSGHAEKGFNRSQIF